MRMVNDTAKDSANNRTMEDRLVKRRRSICFHVFQQVAVDDTWLVAARTRRGTFKSPTRSGTKINRRKSPLDLIRCRSVLPGNNRELTGGASTCRLANNGGDDIGKDGLSGNDLSGTLWRLLVLRHSDGCSGSWG